MLRDLDAVEIAGSRKFHFKNVAQSSRRGRHDHNAISETGRFTDVVGDEIIVLRRFCQIRWMSP